MDFQKQIKHPKWQQKRLEILERDEYMCQNCHTQEETLHVHHFFYKPKTLLWEYDESSLITLCSDCHNEWHCLNDEIKEFLSVDTQTLKEIHNLLMIIRELNLFQILKISKYALKILTSRK